MNQQCSSGSSDLICDYLDRHCSLRPLQPSVSKFLLNVISCGRTMMIPYHCLVLQPAIWDSENASGDNSFYLTAISSQDSSDELRPYICQYPDCDKSFKRKDHLLRHQRSFHGKPWGVDSETVFYCHISECGRVFYKNHSLQRHMHDVHGVEIEYE